jgi:hypothetical protein
MIGLPGALQVHMTPGIMVWAGGRVTPLVSMMTTGRSAGKPEGSAAQQAGRGVAVTRGVLVAFLPPGSSSESAAAPVKNKGR